MASRSAPLSGTRTKVQFLFTKHLSAAYGRLCINIVREVCVYLNIDRFLPAVDGRTLWVFDLKKETRDRRVMKEGFSGGVAQCLIDEYHLLVVGGFRQKNAAFRVNFTSAIVTAEAPMLIGRVCPGVINYGFHVWVFGGIDKTKSCEKFNVISRDWHSVTDMPTPKALFTPCEWAGDIYLPEANSCEKPLEAFNPATEQYRMLPLRLSERSNELVSFISDGELVVLTRWQTIGVWRVDSQDADVRWISSPFKNESSAMASSLPVHRGRYVYWVTSSYELVKFDLCTKTLIEK